MQQHYGMNHRGDIVEHDVACDYRIIWRDGDRLYANDAGMNLLLWVINTLDQQDETSGETEKT